MQAKTVSTGEKNPARGGNGLLGEFLESLDGFQEVKRNLVDQFVSVLSVYLISLVLILMSSVFLDVDYGFVLFLHLDVPRIFGRGPRPHALLARFPPAKSAPPGHLQTFRYMGTARVNPYRAQTFYAQWVRPYPASLLA